MVAEVMWDEVAPDSWKARMAEGMGLDRDAARAWLAFLAGLHDLGKACPGFQLQLGLPHIQERIRAAGLPADQVAWIPHGAVSDIALREILPEQFGVARPVALAISTALGGHHGTFAAEGDLRELPLASIGRTPWRIARERYAEWLAEVLEVPRDRPPVAFAHPTAMAFAGFVSVVDWIGSAEEFFTHAAPAADALPSVTPAVYRGLACIRATEALDALGWMGWTPPQQGATFEQLFPGRSPRPLQEAVIDLAASLRGPAIVVIEAPMGEGKTEAAMYLADSWGVSLGQRGMYFALPTQATSNQMFERVRQFLAQRYPRDLVNLQLLHGHAALSATLEKLRDKARRLLAPGHVYGAGGHPRMAGDVIAAEWFAAGKRALLAPFGVGTVDQALLAALQVMHVFVRLFGLSSKTVIIDEVHAYDTYTSELVDRLLEWLGALGCPVVLLSATLPSGRRRALLRAYAHGAGWPETGDPDEVAYPRVTYATRDGFGARPVEAAADRAREVELDWIDATLPAEGGLAFPLGERLRDLLADGGCAVVICNTVRRAQTVYQALKPYFPGMASDGLPELDLFHARFLFEERDAREQRSVRRFGLEGPRPRCAVLVATQVVEQSLDLDFDLMITDLAPVDLVLQRAGRLHRHDRVRPARLDAPRLLITLPEEILDGDVPKFDGGSEAVYEPHILLRSWLMLRDRRGIQVPGEIASLVEGNYATNDCPAGVSAELRRHWEATRAKMDARRLEDAQEARNRYIKRPDFDGGLARVVDMPREEDAPELHPKHQALTRLTEPTTQVVCLGGTQERPLIRPGGAAINLEVKPNLATTRELLRRSVSVTSRRVVFDLLAMETPSGWQKSPLLRRHRALFFGPDGVATVGKWRIRLDPDLGVVIEEASATARSEE